MTRRAKGCRALTILEMLVSVAMLSFIVLGLTAMFVQTQKAFKSGIKQNTITDAGRTIIDMMAEDFSQMADPRFMSNIYYPSNLVGLPPTLYWSAVPNLEFYQTNYGSFILRTNQTEDIFATILTNNMWMGIGYTVSNWFYLTNGGGLSPFPGVGTLYRYTAATNGPLFSTNDLLYNSFYTNINNNLFPNSLFHRIADGVVHLKIIAYDASGNEMYLEPYYDAYNQTSWGNSYLQYPVIQQISNSSGPTGLFQTNFLPHSIDIELGILEPEALEHARALFTSGATQAASNYLYNATGQVETFRQHVIISAAP